MLGDDRRRQATVDQHRGVDAFAVLAEDETTFVTVAADGQILMHQIAAGEQGQEVPGCSRQMQRDDGAKALQHGTDQQRFKRVADIDDGHRHAREHEFLIDQCGLLRIFAATGPADF
ncbi:MULTISPECIES: hypothetical protein [Ensifer]|uniref:hypothetical protein n=1 Tax=Ensifer TaxID=106591 RepID=UPI001AECCB82|nr:hypothetical protein [Ensifer adhaerens]